MKTFDDLEFQTREFPKGIISRIHFANGWGASVVSDEFSYGGKEGLFEVAVLKDGDIHYENEVAGGDVIGYLTSDQVTETLEKIQKLK
jgi:hypothetical protein